MRPGKIFRAVLAGMLLLLVATACHSADPKAIAEQEAYLETVGKAKALYEERCAKVAGEKIYKTVHNVDGILLMNVPAMGGERQWFDRNWPGAAFAHSRHGLERGFIDKFLWYETTPPGSGVRSLNTSPTDKPGYRYVDVIDEKDGRRYRYSGRWEEPWQYDKSYLKGYIKFFLDKNPTTEPAPRYGIRFEDHVIPDERALWVASGTIKVVDLNTNEVLGEMTRYAIAYTRPVPGASPPWLSAYTCGGHGGTGVHRHFVDQVLKPIKGK